MMHWTTWLGIALCLSQSAMFSGLNLGMLGPSRLRLQVAAQGGDRGAEKILALREDFHLLLTTILWGNVAANTLLALLADSILTGVSAFFVSTIAITIFGEIIPQAVVSRHAFRIGGALAPLIRAYRFVLMPVAWPTARLLDYTIGEEGHGLLLENDLREMLKVHIREDSSDVSHVEGRGALNFLAIDDRKLSEEAEPLHPSSILALPVENGSVRFPDYEARIGDPFLAKVHASERKWVVITDPKGEPQLVLNANRFLRAVMMTETPVDPRRFCHPPVTVSDPNTPLEQILTAIELRTRRPHGQALHPDLVLLWTPEHKRVLTGADLLENLLRGIATGDAA